MFKIGDKVEKEHGYRFPGVIVAAFKKRDGQRRFVVEFDGEDGEGMLHIFSPHQLKRREL